MKRNRPAKSRFRGLRGYLMLDLIIVMSLTVVVLSTTSVWLYKTIRYTAEISQRDSHCRNISRISRQLRFDVRGSKSVSVNGNTLTIAGDSISVEYLIDANAVRRTVTGGEKTHRDEFEFTDNAKLEWKKDLEGTDIVEGANNVGGSGVSLEISRDFSSMSATKTETAASLDARIRIQSEEASQ